MKRTPKKGEPYQLCIHLAAEPNRNDRHFWHVSSRDRWIVLCDECHADFSERKSVDIHGEIFTLPADVAIEPGSSSIHHSAPADTVLVDKPATEPATEKESPKASAAERLIFRPKAKAPDLLPLLDRGLTALMETSRAFQAQAKARADADLRRMELEAQATERILRLLDASTAAAERLTSLAIEQDAVIVEMIRRMRAEWRSDEVLGSVAQTARQAISQLSSEIEPRQPRRKPQRRV